MTSLRLALVRLGTMAFRLPLLNGGTLTTFSKYCRDLRLSEAKVVHKP